MKTTCDEIKLINALREYVRHNNTQLIKIDLLKGWLSYIERLMKEQDDKSI